MSLEQQIQSDIKAAMVAKDKVALAATRAVKAAILLAKTSEGGAKDSPRGCRGGQDSAEISEAAEGECGDLFPAGPSGPCGQ